ncbi:hypothetical protein [Symmachiella dynata]|uniref:hypothetical protein n=1 Tax=Symmachiella dynata TaxID=2527995 RepID=UPI0011A1C2CF|nr:hypothetical protein [Symmachiella dynata]
MLGRLASPEPASPPGRLGRFGRLVDGRLPLPGRRPPASPGTLGRVEGRVEGRFEGRLMLGRFVPGRLLLGREAMFGRLEPGRVVGRCGRFGREPPLGRDDGFKPPLGRVRLGRDDGRLTCGRFFDRLAEEGFLVGREEDRFGALVRGFCRDPL